MINHLQGNSNYEGASRLYSQNVSYTYAYLSSSLIDIKRYTLGSATVVITGCDNK